MGHSGPHREGQREWTDDWFKGGIVREGTIEAMLTHGGSFAQALAKAYQLGDDKNRARLFVAFEDLFTEYEEIARLQVERRCEEIARLHAARKADA